jgi:hypothetical protein
VAVREAGYRGRRRRSYHRDIASIARNDAAATTTSTICATCQPKASTTSAKSVGETPLTTRS